ncbi:MAG: helix-turn-helix domain-containing protein [Nitrososphaerota archaeon]|jgi:predicted transcriptional regulator|nr:helix-turn-helix domain-containing protein [Nitrososphaerota archaeon]MDG6903365.1 helix-turn-helix domain-containing protein [Nitrososphaerota archaeon]MDG6911773.1 helix-turn-helix domain-containing protein [Nitrososphaerota archaeon]MDG6940745.1 helix-turn-helix domain-containing protein [Nitrososphaerota archaeon]MDG6945650.1 helix-turn-helix domain-containing protein [Nitrososphaerota archaeon]
MPRLISPYEIVAKSALPALRAMVARRLQEEYHLTQQEVARRLGVTQASVSNYARKTRGIMVNLEGDSTVVKAADGIAKELSLDQPDTREALRSMTEVLDYIRFNKMMCILHGDLEPEFKVEGCYACEGTFSVKDFDRLKLLVGN